MKRRFIFYIGLATALAMFAIGLVQFLLFRSERARLIDSRIEATASLLISSDLSHSELQDYEEAQSTIEEVLGGERYNQFVVITDKSGEIFYKSRSSADELPDKIPADQKWQTIEEDGHILRILTVPIGDRILQTGLIQDAELVRVRDMNRLVLIFSVIFLNVFLIVTVALSRVLLRPLQELSKYLRYLTQNFDRSVVLGKLDAQFPALPRGSERDEFGQLVTEVQLFSAKVAEGLHRTQIWTAQLVHEIKTPLTVMMTRLNKAETQAKSPDVLQSISEAKQEVYELSELVSQFLEWSQAENLPPGSEELHALKLRKTVEEYVLRLQSGLPGANQERIRLQFGNAVTDQDIIFVHAQFIEHIIGNLITNALKYSPTNEPVDVIVENDSISVLDRGPGLPDEVIAHLGQPFNSGGNGQSRGHGLGLAWVATICRRYNWNLSFSRTPENLTKVSVRWTR